MSSPMHALSPPSSARRLAPSLGALALAVATLLAPASGLAQEVPADTSELSVDVQATLQRLVGKVADLERELSALKAKDADDASAQSKALDELAKEREALRAELEALRAEVEAGGGGGGGDVFDRVLVQLNWGDDNLFIDAGETRENSPDPNFGRCAQTRIDGTVRRDCSQGSSRLGLYKSVDISQRLVATGALVLGLAVDTNPESRRVGGVSLYDLGSYAKLAYFFDDARTTSFYTELYPVDARPLVLGFHPDLEWGTKDEFPKNFRRGAAPGLKLAFQMPNFYAFVGAKSALLKSPLEVELDNEGGNRILFATRTYYGVLGGLGYGGAEGFTAELNGGWFHKGTLTKEGVLGKDMMAGGGSLRLAWKRGLDVGLRVDAGLYQRSAVGAQTIQRPQYDGGFAYNISAEGSALVQLLNDFERPGSTRLEPAWATHAGFQMRYDDFRLHLENRIRSLTYITAEVPGFFPYSTLPENADVFPEIQTLLSVDYRFSELTVAVTGGVRLPATYRGQPAEGASTDPSSAGVRTVVVSDADAGGWYILPEGETALPVWWVELGLQWHPSEEFAVLAEVLYGQDGNRTQVERNEFGHAVRVFTEPNVLALNLMGQFLF